MDIWFWVAIAASATVSFGVTRYCLGPSSPCHVLDIPNDRSMHSTPVPRSGGVGVLVGVAAGGVIYWLTDGSSDPELFSLGVAALVLAVVSFWDDVREVHPGGRLLVHLALAMLLVWIGIRIDAISLPGLVIPLPGWLAACSSVVFIVWMLNLFNFMDGMDGLAGGMAVFGFSTLALLAGGGASEGLSLMAACVAASSLGFLVWNFPPARVFLGDVGSAPLGLTAGALALWGDRQGAFPLWVALLVFSPFVVDASVTLVRRLLKREAVWKPHREHYYQRAGIGPWGKKRTLIAEYLLMLGCASSALLFSRGSAGLQWTMFAIWAGVYICAMWTVDRRPMSDREV